MTGSVRITDVSPRDGLQSEPGVIETADKQRLVNALCATGVDEVEVTSFVSPKWIPQLADAAPLLESLRDDAPAERPVFSVLVPNERGLDRAFELLDAGCPIDKIAVFTAVSETFSQRNTNASIDETLERFVPVLARARDRGLQARAYLSCVVACPYDGPMPTERSADLARRLLDLGADEIDLGDTIGAGTPETIDALVRTVLEAAASAPVTLHLHDTFGRAADCVLAALDAGVRSFDGAAGGLGGCPYASTDGARAPGNIATARLVETIQDAGYSTGVDLGKLARADAIAGEMTGREP